MLLTQYISLVQEYMTKYDISFNEARYLIMKQKMDTQKYAQNYLIKPN